MPAIAEASAGARAAFLSRHPSRHVLLRLQDVWRPFPPLSGGVLVKKLYVGNLPFQASEEEIGEWFGQTGVTPSNITLIRDRFTGQPRGFGFVEIQNDEEAERAIQALNGQQFKGRNVVVNEARPMREGGGGGGGRGGGRGGFGGGRGGRGGGGGGGRGGERREW